MADNKAEKNKKNNKNDGDKEKVEAKKTIDSQKEDEKVTKASSKAKLSQQEIIAAIEQMTVLELADLVKALEEKFDITAAPVAAPVATAGVAAESEAAEEKEEQTVFNVVLSSFGENKIAVIKAVRELVPTLGLADAKKLVESAPSDVLTQVDKKTANEAKEKLEKAGAKVELK